MNTETIDKLYKEHIAHDELPKEFQIGMECFLDALKAQSAATPPDVEQMAEEQYKKAIWILQLCERDNQFMSDEERLQLRNAISLLKQAGQSAVQDATPQEGEMSSNEYHLRCAWDRTCEDRDNWKAEAKALSAIKKGLETSLTEAFSSLSAAQEENKKLRQDLDLALQPRG